MKIFTEFDESNNTAELKKYLTHWKFELSPFQKNSILGLSKGKNVLITAHTGSGKTLPAEFAIVYFVNKGKRVIYTSPIKALTNQKFDEFSNEFPNISFGLITGDNKFNPDAQVLLMTQEILTNTLERKRAQEMSEEHMQEKYKELLSFDMDIDSELGCVIMDEAHYIGDRDRGRVWEEGIMWLSPHIQMLLLSATLDKVNDISDLIEKRGGEEVWVCPTKKRVVPLTHYAYLTIPKSNFRTMKMSEREDYEKFFDKLIPLKKPNGKFEEEVYNKLRKVTQFMDLKRIRVNKFFVINEMLQLLNTQDNLPAIMFVFSKKQVNLIASKIQVSLFNEDSKVPSLIDKECEALLRKKLPNYKEYLVLPEYHLIVSLLRKGIAIHHASILKEFREMIELLFKKKYIKLLIATETFAVGINMPTKTTIFTSLQKFDGKGFRWLHPHELIQMAGRAGRRGIDERGSVLYLLNLFTREEVPPSIFRNMLTGKPRSVHSKFTIHTNLLMRLISVKNYNFAQFIEKSMLSKELIATKKKLEEDHEELLQGTSAHCVTFRTPTDTLDCLHHYKTTVNLMKGKHKKRRMRDISNLEESTKFIKSDYGKYTKYLESQKIVRNLETRIHNVDTYIDTEVNIQLKMLEEEGFIIKQDEILKLTKKGNVAINIHELSSLAISEILEDNILGDLTPIEIAGVLSCFTNIRLSEEQSVLSIEYIDADDHVKAAIRNIKGKYNKYFDILTRLKLDIVENYEMHYNMCELTMKWCKANSAVECLKLFKTAKLYDIQLGDFVKAMLKINNILQELGSAVIIQEDIKLLEKLKQIPILILKSCVTNQSLYL